MTTLLIAEHEDATLNGATHKAVAAAKALGGDIHVLVAGAILIMVLRPAGVKLFDCDQDRMVKRAPTAETAQ
jgi:electron transfer flavoprotein alpha subunit